MLENPNRKNQEKLFNQLVYSNIHRQGISDLMTFLEETDFFYAPASTKYHGAYRGGLLDHSLCVYYQALKLANVYDYNLGDQPKYESLCIASLFHDVCKIYQYQESERNVKNEETGLWEKQAVYIFQPDKFQMQAHGAQSVFTINKFMKLTDSEATAIYHHMGNWDASKYDNVALAYETYRLAWIIHVADEAATYVDGI